MQRTYPLPHLFSTSRGDFMCSPRGCTAACFYVVVTDFHGHPTKGINENTVGVPMKPPLLASCKSNNYLLNALTTMEAQVTSTKVTMPAMPISCSHAVWRTSCKHLKPQSELGRVSPILAAFRYGMAVSGRFTPFVQSSSPANIMGHSSSELRDVSSD